MNDERTEPRILVVDVETTGLNAEAHSILEIGAVWLTGDVGEFHRECRAWAGAAIDPTALQLNGWTVDGCANPALPSEAEVIREFLSWVGYDSVILAGLNPSFDRAFLKAAKYRADRATLKTFSHRVLDLHSLAVSYALAKGDPVPSRGYHTDEIYAVLGLDPEPHPHVALVGARKEAEALRMLMGLPEVAETRRHLNDNPLDCAP